MRLSCAFQASNWHTNKRNRSPNKQINTFNHINQHTDKSFAQTMACDLCKLRESSGWDESNVIQRDKRQTAAPNLSKFRKSSDWDEAAVWIGARDDKLWHGTYQTPANWVLEMNLTFYPRASHRLFACFMSEMYENIYLHEVFLCFIFAHMFCSGTLEKCIAFVFCTHNILHEKNRIATFNNNNRKKTYFIPIMQWQALTLSIHIQVLPCSSYFKLTNKQTNISFSS